MSTHPNVFNGSALVWACRWVDAFDPRKHAVLISMSGFSFPLRAAVVDDFGALVEVPR